MLPLERRKRLITLAHRYGFDVIGEALCAGVPLVAVVCLCGCCWCIYCLMRVLKTNPNQPTYRIQPPADEVYQLLSFPDAPPPPPPMRAVERQMIDSGELQSALQFNRSSSAAKPQRGLGAAGAASGSGGDAQRSPNSSEQQQQGAGEGEGGQSITSRVVSLGSWSKMLAPGLRLGWAEACAPTLKKLRSCGVLISGGGWSVQRLGFRLACLQLLETQSYPSPPPCFDPRPTPQNTKTTGCIAPLSAAVGHSALELGLLSAHLQGHVRPTLAERCGALCDELEASLAPLGCSYRRPEGGYFVWVTLPEEVGLSVGLNRRVDVITPFGAPQPLQKSPAARRLTPNPPKPPIQLQPGRLAETAGGRGRAPPRAVLPRPQLPRAPQRAAAVVLVLHGGRAKGGGAAAGGGAGGLLGWRWRGDTHLKDMLITLGTLYSVAGLIV